MGKQKNQAAVELGQRGGKARARLLKPDELRRIAKRAAASRWEDHEYSDEPAAVYARQMRAKKLKSRKKK